MLGVYASYNQLAATKRLDAKTSLSVTRTDDTRAAL